MSGKQLYHGGSANGGNKFSTGGGFDRHYTFSYGNTDILSVGDYCYPIDGGGLGWSNGMGNYIVIASRVVGVGVNIFKVNSAGVADRKLNVMFRRITADGSSPAALAAGGITAGTLIRGIGITAQQSVSDRFYLGGGDHSMNESVPAGEMIFVIVNGKTISMVEGFTAWVNLERI